MNENYPENGAQPPLDKEVTAEFLGLDDLDADVDAESDGRIRTILAGGAAVAVIALAVVGGIALSSESSGTTPAPGGQANGEVLSVAVAGKPTHVQVGSCDSPAAARFTATLTAKRTPVDVTYRWVVDGASGTDRHVTLRAKHTTLTHKVKAAAGSRRVSATLKVIRPTIDQPEQAVVQVRCGAAGESSTTATQTDTATETVPALVGLSAKDATAALKQFGLSARIRYVDGGIRGTVVETWPVAGTPVPKGSTVQLDVGKGATESASLTMPDLVDKTELQARALLKEAGWHGRLEITNSPTIDPRQDGLIEYQNPRKGTHISADDVIELAIWSLDDRSNDGEPEPTSEQFPHEPN